MNADNKSITGTIERIGSFAFGKDHGCPNVITEYVLKLKGHPKIFRLSAHTHPELAITFVGDEVTITPRVFELGAGKESIFRNETIGKSDPC